MFLAFTSRSDLYIIQSDDYWVDFSIGNKRKEAFIRKKKKFKKTKTKTPTKPFQWSLLLIVERFNIFPEEG